MIKGSPSAASLNPRFSVLMVPGHLFLVFLLLCLSIHAAEQFGDISVEPNAIYTGNTFHGYAEMRLIVENHSSGKAHVVTLVFPNHYYGGSGNAISEISRTVKLVPGAREIVSLLQPPLPAAGDGSIRVEVDNRHEGEVRAPNANNHCNNYSRSGQATVFISRSLDFDAVGNIFRPNTGVFTAAMAVGPPDTASGGYMPTSWMPDARRVSQTNWLELDYSAPQMVDKFFVHQTQLSTSSGSIELMGISGTNIATIPMSSGVQTKFGSPICIIEFSMPPAGEPVKTIRLNFGKESFRVAVDAVEISGPTGRQWAADARASSDNSASAPSYGARADAVENLRAESPLSEWSENWLAYSPFDAIVLSAADLSSMPPAVFGAVENYLQAGGNVVLFGKVNLPAIWHPAKKTPLPDGVNYTIGFGHCLAFNSEKLSLLDSKSIQALREAVRNSAQYWQSLPNDNGSANSVLQVVQNLKIPTRGIVIIMLAFVIIIGPVNIILLNRRKRRTWMLWTIPAISFATTLLVFAYSLLREGITPDTRIVGLTLLDQGSHRAATIGGTAFYCPLTPSGGLHFDFETEATPLIQAGGSGISREVDWTQSQHFQHGWISARVPAHFHLRKAETRRERIQVVNENGTLQIVNGLGAPIKSLWLADAGMNLYEANNVAAGQKAGLSLAKDLQASEKFGATELLHDISFVAQTDKLQENAGKYLLPNTYIAVLEANPFIENALKSASNPKRTKSSAVVFGFLESSETK